MKETDEKIDVLLRAASQKIMGRTPETRSETGLDYYRFGDWKMPTDRVYVRPVDPLRHIFEWEPSAY